MDQPQSPHTGSCFFLLDYIAPALPQEYPEAGRDIGRSFFCFSSKIFLLDSKNPFMSYVKMCTTSKISLSIIF